MPGETPESGDTQRTAPKARSDVFISYASQDKAIAEAVCEALERSGVVCWIAPRDVVPGESYAAAIVHSIDATKVVVLVLSENGASSQHVLREVERASSKRHPVVAFRIDLAPMPADLEYFLNTSQWLDASALGVERALPKLIDAVQRALAPVSVVSPGGRTGSAVPPVANASQQPPTATQARRQPSGTVLTLGAVIALGLVYFVVDKLWLAKHSASERPAAAVIPATAPAALAVSEKSVAVLPFVDMSEKKDQEYFSDGLSEELIDMLAKVPDLRVPARTSSFYFKGKSEDIPTIARRLMVAHVLEGSVRKSGVYLRITAQLVRADNGYHLWSQTYDRKLDDIFKVQDEIAGAVVSALKVSLGESSTLKVATTKNTEAYTLYLQGCAILKIAGNKEQFDNAAEYMRRAVKADPLFAKAWAWLAIVLGNGVGHSYLRADAVAAEMRRTADQALALEPNLADAHSAKSLLHALDWDWETAAAEAQKAYDVDPTDAGNALYLSKWLYGLHGESDAALALLRKGIELDPANYDAYVVIGEYYMETGKLPEAEAAFRKALELFPTGPDLHAYLGNLLLLRGEATAALAEFQREPDEADRRQGAAIAYFALGRKAKANAALSEMERLDATIRPSNFAEAFAYRGESNQAFTWLDRAYQQRDPGVAFVNRDPFLKRLHGDPRWKAFLRKMKLPE